MERSLVLAALAVQTLALTGVPTVAASQDPPPSGVMDCTPAFFQSLDLRDEAFGQPAEILAAMVVPASTLPPFSEYCAVQGTLWPEIGFEVMLPATWNQRLYMAGNGGTAGFIPTFPMRQAVQQGYAATGTNAGHDGTANPGSTFAWADQGGPNANPLWQQKLYDFNYRSVHETVVLAKKIAHAYYGLAPVRSYWVGCSTGGRQGLMEAQRFPLDFDGIVAGAPASNVTVALQGPAYLQPQVPAGSQIPPAKLPMLAEAVYRVCDDIDGLKDELIDDPRKCAFDPEVDLTRCPEGADDPTCVTNAQLAAIKRIYGGAFSNGTLVVPGLPKGSEGLDSGWHPIIVDDDLRHTSRYVSSSGFFKYLAWDTPRPDYEFLTDWNFDADMDGLRPSFGEAVDPDLSAFKANGGKLLMYHGWADAAINPLATSLPYHDSVVELMGDQAQDVLAFYMVPGMAHCSAGIGFGNVDWLTPLVDWVEKGIAPGSIVGSSSIHPDWTRPICRYPGVARYNGTGAVGDAASFACARSEHAFAGFFPPVDNPPVVNAVKAGSGVPLKFSLGGFFGLDIFAVGYPRSVQVQCSGAGLLDVIEETSSAGTSGLSYDAATDQYTYVWKTKKAWAGSCRQLQVGLDDGKVRSAAFSFR